jgi:hypothetical protein
VTVAWPVTMLSCETFTAVVEWQFSQYVFVWQAAHDWPTGSADTTLALWPNTQSRSL